MNIQDLKEKSKLFLDRVKERLPKDANASRYYTAAAIVLVGLSSFGLGRLSMLDDNREPIVIENALENPEVALPPAAGGRATSQSALVISAVNGQMSSVKSSNITAGGQLVASRNGAKYYFPWCAGAAKIAGANKIWFNSESEAKEKGYQPAGNCKGLR